MFEREDARTYADLLKQGLTASEALRIIEERKNNDNAKRDGSPIHERFRFNHCDAGV